MKWVLVALALLYALIPFDFLPDLVAGWGWLDDLFLLGLVWYLLFHRRGWPTRTADPDRDDESNDSREHFQQSSAQMDGSGVEIPKDPYDILGIEAGASQADIQAAYRRLAAQYHPDKLAHLGEEFQALAEEKFKVIQSAYEMLRDRG
jgi:DnaJ like chaperone protein